MLRAYKASAENKNPTRLPALGCLWAWNILFLLEPTTLPPISLLKQILCFRPLLNTAPNVTRLLQNLQWLLEHSLLLDNLG